MGEVETSFAVFQKQYIADNLNKKLHPFDVETNAQGYEKTQLAERLELLIAQKSITDNELQIQKIDLYLWNKVIEACVNYRVDINDQYIDYSKTLPSLNRILYDQLYNSQTQYGLGDEQVMLDKSVALNTIIKVLSDK